MAVLTAPPVPPVSQPMTWAEICATYPDQLVGLTDVVTDGDRWWIITSARVFCHGTPDEVMPWVGTGPGLPYPGSRHGWTGQPTTGEAYFAARLAMHARRAP